MTVTITASEARGRLFPLIEGVNEDRAAIRITSRRGNAVLLAEEDYDSLLETAYLFRTPANARRLIEADAALRRGEGVAVDLDRA